MTDQTEPVDIDKLVAIVQGPLSAMRGAKWEYVEAHVEPAYEALDQLAAIARDLEGKAQFAGMPAWMRLWEEKRVAEAERDAAVDRETGTSDALDDMRADRDRLQEQCRRISEQADDLATQRIERNAEIQRLARRVEQLETALREIGCLDHHFCPGSDVFVDLNPDPEEEGHDPRPLLERWPLCRRCAALSSPPKCDHGIELVNKTTGEARCAECGEALPSESEEDPQTFGPPRSFPKSGS